MGGLKVALITTWRVRCGIASYSENLAKALAEENVEVYVVRLPRFGFKLEEVFVDVAERVPDDVDLIHVQHEYGLFGGLEKGFYGALMQKRKPVVTTMHAVGSWGVDDLVVKMSKKVIVHNNFCFKRVKYANTVIIPHGASPTVCPPREEAKKAEEVEPSVPIVGYVGFIGPYKGIEVLIEAMKNVKAGLLVGGGWHTEDEPTYIPKLREFSSQILKERVRWLGFVPDDKLSQVYGAMDVFVYPSRFATESGALIAALSHGKAVVASNLPPFKEKEKQGALMTFKHISDLSKKIKQLLKDEDLRRQLQEGARRYCEKTSWSKVAKQHVELYRQVLKA